jgi:glycosyltransferase involved in cell wall biosynthesis
MKIKILHIIKSLGRGGAEMLLPETLKLHNQDQFEFHYIYFLPWKDQMESALKDAGAFVTCLSAKNNIELLLQTAKVKAYVKKHGIQVIHAHLPWAGFLARLVYKQTALPLIYTEHNKQERYHQLTFLLNKITFNWQSKAIAVSTDVEVSIKDKIHPKIPVQTVLNGVNTDFFQRKSIEELLISANELTNDTSSDNFRTSNNAEKALAFDNGQEILKNLSTQKKADSDMLIVGTISVFRFQKRLLEWIKVFHAASLVNPKLRAVIVGNGPFAQQLLDLRDQLGLTDKLFLPGLQTNTRDWFSLMDIFMMTSEFEGLPIALLEAMSMECAVATTNAGGVKEVIQKDISGLMVDVDEWDQLAEKLEILRDNKLRLSLARKARERVLDSFSLKRMVNELEDVYLDVLNDGN